MNDLLNQIRAAQERLGLSDQECGERLGLEKDHATHWRMSFRRSVSRKRLEAMAAAVGCRIQTTEKLVRVKP